MISGLHEGSLSPPSVLQFGLLFVFLFWALVSGVTGVKRFWPPSGALSPSSGPSIFMCFVGSGVRGHRSEVMLASIRVLSGPFQDLQFLCFFLLLALVSGVTRVK